MRYISVLLSHPLLQPYPLILAALVFYTLRTICLALGYGTISSLAERYLRFVDHRYFLTASVNHNHIF